MGLLEEAIVDANELKKAALKNAENIIKEKHAQEIKEEFMRFLEQDEDPLADLGGLDVGMDGPQPLDLTASQLPNAATDGERACACPEEDEEIEIDFDQLRAQMNDPIGTQQQPSPGLGSDEPPVFQEMGGEQISLPSQLGPELHQYVMSKDDSVYQLGSLALANKPAPSSLIQSALSDLQSYQGKLEDQNDEQHLKQVISQLQSVLPQQTPQEPQDDLGLSEDFFNDLMETLEVDLENVPLGHGLRATTADKKRAEDLELASLRDAQKAKEWEELQKTVAQLKKENQSLVQKNEQMIEQIKSTELEKNKFVGFAQKAGNKLEKYVVDNAKLHFENQVLKSNSLNERQKEILVERISTASSAEEAKLMFESMKDSVRTREQMKEKMVLGEHLKKDNPFLRAKQEPKISPEKNRMLALAGIKKNNN